MAQKLEQTAGMCTKHITHDQHATFFNPLKPNYQTYDLLDCTTTKSFYSAKTKRLDDSLGFQPTTYHPAELCKKGHQAFIFNHHRLFHVEVPQVNKTFNLLSISFLICHLKPSPVSCDTISTRPLHFCPPERNFVAKFARLPWVITCPVRLSPMAADSLTA